MLIAAMISQASSAVVISVPKCEELYAKLSSADPWLKTQCGSSLAWGEAALIDAILDLYEVTGDREYLREVVRRCDRMLSHRDDARGLRDSTGEIHKAWSMAGKYTVAESVLADDAGRPSIRLRSTPYAYNNQTEIEVTVSGDTFTLHVTNEFFKRDETFSDLSLDPASTRYFAKVINNPKPVPSPKSGTCTECSMLLKASPAGMDAHLPKAQTVTMDSLRLSYCGYIGIIYHPLLRFAELVKADKSLKEFEPDAKRFTEAADESYKEFRSHWRNGPGKDEGYYITCERGGAFPYDNLPEPFNYHGGHVASEAALYRLTGDKVYRDHVRRMANLLKHRLELKTGDLYVWHYWYEPLNAGYTAADDISDNYPDMAPKAVIEDCSHGTLDVRLAMEACRAGEVFDNADLRRFANTFLKNVCIPGSADFHARVDGTGGPDEYSRVAIDHWLPLAETDPAVYDACRKVYILRGQDGFAPLAGLLLAEKQLKHE